VSVGNRRPRGWRGHRRRWTDLVSPGRRATGFSPRWVDVRIVSRAGPSPATRSPIEEPAPMLGVTLGAKDYLDRVCREIQRLDVPQVQNVAALIESPYRAGGFVFICGNGGSGATASHLSEDLAKCTLRDFEHQKRLRVLSLTDNTAGIMAWAN